MLSRVSRWRRGADRRVGKEILVLSLDVSNEIEKRETGPSGFSWESMVNLRGPRGSHVNCSPRLLPAPPRSRSATAYLAKSPQDYRVRARDQ